MFNLISMWFIFILRRSDLFPTISFVLTSIPPFHSIVLISPHNRFGYHPSMLLWCVCYCALAMQDNCDVSMHFWSQVSLRNNVVNVEGIPNHGQSRPLCTCLGFVRISLPEMISFVSLLFRFLEVLGMDLLILIDLEQKKNVASVICRRPFFNTLKCTPWYWLFILIIFLSKDTKVHKIVSYRPRQGLPPRQWLSCFNSNVMQ